MEDLATISNFNIALIAGSGSLPKDIANNLLLKNINFILIALIDNTENNLNDLALKNNILNFSILITELSKLVKILKQNNITHVILAGGISSRPSLKDLKFDKYSLMAFQSLLGSLKKGDDSLLSAFIKFLEHYNIKVVAPDYFVPELLAPLNSVLTKTKITKKNKIEIKKACEILNLLSTFDFGQGAVVIGERLVALEGPEGTDMMLKRVKYLKEQGKIKKDGGILVKLTKIGQEKRVDLPTIGENTVQLAYESGLHGIAIEANASFILNKNITIGLANKYKLFIQTISNKEYYDDK